MNQTLLEEAIAPPQTGVPAQEAPVPTYYDRPLLNEPVWKAYIPMYYFTGGAAGATLALGAAAQLDRSGRLDAFVRRCHWLGIAGSTLGAALLIADLGRPARFIYMLRVFRPTSALNMGAWILAGAPAAALTAGVFSRSGAFEWIGEGAGLVSGLFGAALATYTGVLVGATAIPAWQESRRVLPVLFGASAAAAAASVYDLIYSDDRRAATVTRWFGASGRAAELVATHSIAGGGALRTSASVLTAASLVASLLPRQSRKKRVIAGALGAAGSLLLRFAVHRAGIQSARDPRAAFRQQGSGPGSGSRA